MNEVLRGPKVQALFARLTLHAVASTPAEAASFIRRETQVWGDVIKQAGIKPH